MQSAFTKQPTHAFLVTSIASFRHFGVAPAQSPLTKQAVQRFVVARSQIGLTPEHCSIAVHSTQAFSVGSTLVKHWLSGDMQAVALVDVQVTHLFAPRSQAGVLPEQLASPRHCTQLFIAGLTLTLHCALGAMQPEPATHGTQVLVAVSQAGVPPEQSALVRHWTHWLSFGSALTLHLGVMPAQPKPAVQVTHCSMVPSQAGLGSAQSALAMHSAQ